MHKIYAYTQEHYEQIAQFVYDNYKELHTVETTGITRIIHVKLSKHNAQIVAAYALALEHTFSKRGN